MILLLLSLLVSIAIGFLVTCLLWPDARPLSSHFSYKLYLAVGQGVGISSCCFFLWLLIAGSPTGGIIIAEVCLLGVLIAGLIYVIKKSRRPVDGELTSASEATSKFYWVATACFYVALIMTTVTLVILMLKKPHGEWDAWAIWNMRARFLARGGDQWKAAFSNLLEWSRPDYPLLLPGFIARCWKYMGKEAVIVPGLVAGVFTAITAGLLFSSISIIRSKGQGVAAGLTLLGTASFISQGSWQYADVPLGFFFLAAITLLCLQEHLPGKNYRLAALAGMAAGFAGWTKNEGLLFIVALVVAQIIAITLFSGLKACLRQMLYFALGLLPVVLIIVYFKTQLAPPNYLFAVSENEPLLGRLTDYSKYSQILRAVTDNIVTAGVIPVNLLLLLLIYLVCLGVATSDRNKLSIVLSLTTVALMAVGYFGVYLATPLDLKWQLNTSLSRLLLQLWPSFLFAFFLLPRTPEQVISLRHLPGSWAAWRKQSTRAS